jgi:hypothetical protein
MPIDLKKIEASAPELLNSAKATQLSLEKVKLNNHTARVVLVLDVSGSMESLYSSGKVNELVKRVLPLGLGFDDDGEVDVFAFGTNAKEIGGYGLTNYKDCVKDILAKTSWSGTRYDTALKLIDQKYGNSTQPVYVMFVTDGDTENKSGTEELIRTLSGKPVFIQFIGLGAENLPEKRKKATGFFAKLAKSMSTPLEFLEKLDDMEGRVIDNVNFFSIKDPTSLTDERFYELLMGEYPQWLQDAKAKGILR